MGILEDKCHVDRSSTGHVTEEDASVVKHGRAWTLEVPLWDIAMDCNACYLDAVYGAF